MINHAFLHTSIHVHSTTHDHTSPRTPSTTPNYNTPLNTEEVIDIRSPASPEATPPYTPRIVFPHDSPQEISPPRSPSTHSYSPHAPEPTIMYPPRSTSSHDATLPHWSATNAKRARYHSICPACHIEIPVGAAISYQFQYRRFVHAHCASGPREHPSYSPPRNPNPPQAQPFDHDPLAPGSPLDALSPDYRAEAVRWVQYHASHVRIPGIHKDFDLDGLERYLAHRSTTNKNLTVILCKLKKMGEICGFVLCTSKYQQPSLQYQKITSIKKKLKKTRRLAGHDATVNEALATGNFAVSMLLSAFDVRSAKRFGEIHPTHREFILIFVMQHAGCARFGIFRNTDVLRSHILLAAHERARIMRSKWRKTNKSNRPFSIKFQYKPRSKHPSRYAIPGARGPTYVTAAKIIDWYLQVTGLKDAAGHKLLFPNLANLTDRRRTYARWLKTVFKTLLPPSCNLHLRIRPHSGRAGWATDRARQGTSSHTILLEGRWSDPKAMAKYIRTSLRDLLTSAYHRPIPDSMKRTPFH